MNNNDNLFLENAYKKVYLREGLTPSNHALDIHPEEELGQILSSLLKRTPQSPELQRAKQLFDIIIAEMYPPGPVDMSVRAEDDYGPDEETDFGNTDE